MRDDSWNLTQVRSRGTACEHFPGHFARYVITGPWWLFGPNPVSPAGQKLEPFQSKVTLDPALALAEIVAGPVILLQVIYRQREGQLSFGNCYRIVLTSGLLMMVMGPLPPV